MALLEEIGAIEESMTNQKTENKITYEQFCAEWLDGIEDGNPSSLEKGVRFANKLVSQWLDVTTDDDDFVICDGSGDGGVDIAYLQRSDGDAEENNDHEMMEGDTWYLVQSKYGAAFGGADTILTEGRKVIDTVLGQNRRLSGDAQKLLQKLNGFRQRESSLDRIVLVFATNDPISQHERQTLDDVKILGRERGISGFDVQEVSLMTIYEGLDEVESNKLSVPIKVDFAEQYHGLLVGTVSLMDLFKFLKAYQKQTGSLDHIYQKNVRQYLGKRSKINKGIAETLEDCPERFGLYNNGITIVVSDYSSASNNNGEVTMYEPYIVNGCQTTRTIWDVLDRKLNSGGTGYDRDTENWRERAKRGSLVTKIVRGNETEIAEITRYTNSQTAVRAQDFLAVEEGFKQWADEMARENKIFLEIQRGGIDSRKAWEKQRPEEERFADYVSAFDLVKIYAAGWMGEPGSAFGRGSNFMPGRPGHDRMLNRNGDAAFGQRDFYAAYHLMRAADKVGFGRSYASTRRQSKFLFYYIVIQMLRDVIMLSPELNRQDCPPSAITDAVIKLAAQEPIDALDALCDIAIGVVDEYLTTSSDESAYNEESFNGDLNSFLKSPSLGKQAHSTLLTKLLELRKVVLTSIRTYENNTLTGRELIARALA